MSLKDQLKEHNDKIEHWQNKIRKYESLIREENVKFEPIMEKIREKQRKKDREKHIKELVKKCQKSYIFMVESDDLDILHKIGIGSRLIKIDVVFNGSHRLDNDHHLIRDSTNIDMSSARITKCLYPEIKNELEQYLIQLDEDEVMEKLTYEVDSLCYGYWSGTLEIYILGKFDPKSEPNSESNSESDNS
ncbi:MAG: hypothetical protein E6R13_09190 [Spirochaetes bacterium]|nr:MAG: hypothetical protein E6R13_09190 [Spirochaetota bacterium]